MIQQSLYYKIQLEEKISILPEQINGNLEQNMLHNLKEKLEGFSTNKGIIMKVLKILSYDYGFIDQDNLTASVLYNVKYEAYICSPTNGLEVICMVQKIINGYIFALNGPLMIVISTLNLDSEQFTNYNGEITINSTKKKIKVDDLIKVHINSININLGEKTIMAMCKLINLASEKEINKYNSDMDFIHNRDINDDEELI